MKQHIYAVVALATLACSLTSFAQPDTVWTRTLWAGELAGVFEADDGGVFVVINHEISSFVGSIELRKLSVDGDSLWSTMIEMPESYDKCLEGELDWNGDLLLTCGSGPDEVSFLIRRVFRLSQEGEILNSDDWQWDKIARHASDSTTVEVLMPQNWTTNISVLKRTWSGEVLWANAYELGDTVTIRDAIRDGTARIFILGWVSGRPEVYGTFILCLESIGDSVWYRQSNFDSFYWSGALIGPDDALYIRGFGNGAAQIARWTLDGDSLWRAPVVSQAGDTISTRDWGVAHDGGVFVSGYTGYYPSTGWLLRFRNDGSEFWDYCCWRHSLEGFASSAVVQLTGGKFVVGETLLPSGHPQAPPRILIACFEEGQLSAREPTMFSSFALHPNSPNPFNPTTEISFDLPRATNVTLKVFDLLGREVAVLANGNSGAGLHRVEFDGRELASGVYFYRLDAGDFSQTRKMVLMK